MLLPLFGAVIVGTIFAFIAFIIVRRSATHCGLFTLAAFVLPGLCGLYTMVCTSLLPDGSPGTDIFEPLPNGYHLQALGKMPDFASITSSLSFLGSEIPLTECIGSVAVSGPLVIGQYSHPCDTFNSHPNETYFIFDTRTGQHSDVKTLDALESQLGHPVDLLATDRFKSSDPIFRKQQAHDQAIIFLPPIFAVVGYFAWLICRRFHSIP